MNPPAIAKGCFLPQFKSEEHDYTLVLDLDETLVHTIASPISLQECIVKLRPGAKEFIEEMAKYYELVIFTAGTQDYADYALTFVDPKGCIRYKLYREHVTQNGLSTIKDISRLGRDLSKVIIIDNIAENFQLQSGNGIFINSWEGDETDTSLIDLMPILKNIVENKVKDVRVALRNYRDYQIRKLLNNHILQ